MSLSTTIVKQDVFGNKRYHRVKLTFDSSYPYGGEALTARQCGMSNIDSIILEPAKGFRFEFDHDNLKVQVFSRAPAIVWEEQQTISSNAITLNYPAAYIFYVAQSAAPVGLTDPAATLAANQCKPTAALAAGTRTGLTFHAGLSGVVYVGYITQAWKDVWDNLIQSEAVTVTTNEGTLANVPIAMQSCRITGGTSTNVGRPLDKDDTPATLEYKLAPTTGVIGTAGADVVTGLVATYVKKPASGFLSERLIAEEAWTAASNVNTPTYPLLLYGYSGFMVENGAPPVALVNVAGSLGTDEWKFVFNTGEVKLQADAVTTGTGMYIWGRPEEIPGLMDLEIRNATDLSSLVNVMALVIGS